MSVATVASRALSGVQAPEVTVEVHLGPGLPAFHIVGLPDAEVREARDRVRAALNHAHFEFPARRITVNLAPAELPKDSSRFDLPIALGILAASGQLEPQALEGHEFAGELSLTGELRPVRGALAMAEADALEVAAVHSVSTHGFDATRWGERPFRAPHHSASAAALVGGGHLPRPGEISLAHHGVLFLDELPEFDRDVLEALRQPIETGCVAISRAARQVEFPARFQLIAAMNPCPCGHCGDRSGRCRCTPERIARYRGRISGPLADRIDLKLEVPAPRESELTVTTPGEDSSEIAKRVARAREAQLLRQGKANALLGSREIDRYCATGREGGELLRHALARLLLSPRAYHRVLRVARTVADLAGASSIASEHVAEAIQYRRLDASF